MTELTKQTATDKTNELATLRPLVTIVEEDSGFTLTAELPGVPKENVQVHVENNVLTLEGEIRLSIPEQMESTHAEVSTAKYKRAFTLSRELDSTKIEASQRDGVLTLHIPKAEHAQPRKIEVQVG
ncbi:Hsp20/alpha crystallin family protein [uncultured Thiothrix sp.]|uniref:Hsp20/alpha crystallin family protein n=1 Tax=uncultured Thiothrix sp. TaxID=223185 RepID=UPI002638187E|nr:Hsp20/alpha crystallin family protein [uncultured Thiothrix sp.]